MNRWDELKATLWGVAAMHVDPTVFVSTMSRCVRSHLWVRGPRYQPHRFRAVEEINR